MRVEYAVSDGNTLVMTWLRYEEDCSVELKVDTWIAPS